MERLIKVGKIIPKDSKDIKFSKIGIGFEKLDRDIFDPNKAYASLAKIGVKKARLQSGWQRTEKQKGVYDFAWLDSIVDNLIAIGIEPWICLCYGNEIYSDKAKEIFGGVGVPPICTEEEKTAWYNYVKAVAARYIGRVHYYEVWNEPDCWWRQGFGNSAAEYAEFTRVTAQACREADPSCEVIGLALGWKKDFVEGFAAAGGLDHVDAVTYHSYNIDEETWISKPGFIREILEKYNKSHLKFIQGEGGAQSSANGHGALGGAAFTPLKQAKYLVRHIVTSLGLNVEFASYFSCVDMIEALHGKVGDRASYLDYGYFGVLGADFDEEGRSVGTYTPKPSYYALQNLCSVLAEEFITCTTPVESVINDSNRMYGPEFDFNDTKHYTFKRDNDSYAMFYWVPKNIVTETYEGTISLKLGDEVKGKDIYLTDLLDGTVYKLTEKMVGENDELVNIPVLDAPLMLTFGDFCNWEEI